jgi:hypothetical protein
MISGRSCQGFQRGYEIVFSAEYDQFHPDIGYYAVSPGEAGSCATGLPQDFQ